MSDWKFLPNEGGEEEGLGHAGIETFKGSPYSGIARECSQNSLDAAAKLPDGNPHPVRLIFRYHDLPRDQIPGIESLKKTLLMCLEQARVRKLKKDTEFFERAIQVITEPHIPVLTIEDYGTTGLEGPAEQGSPFYALVKSSGVSQKPNPDAGGSFGIGKNAAFAVTNLRTVFYSTKYVDSANNDHQLIQGKSILVSHGGDGSGAKRATGYWGADGYKPVSNSDSCPEWLRRNQIGTTVASIGFVEESNWHWQMVETLIRNFFAAIYLGSVSFSVYGPNKSVVDINSETLDGLFVHPEVLSASDTAGTTDDLDFSRAMLAAVRSPDDEVMQQEFEGVGSFRLRVLEAEGFPKRVGILRNGMYITDNLRHFGHPLAKFNLSRDFVAVLEPLNSATSSRIRDMESPRHDELSAERIDDLRDRKRLKSAMKKVGDWIREEIKSATTRPAEDDVLLDEMNRFFSRPGEAPSIPDPSNLNDDPERMKFSPVAVRSTPPVGSGDDGDSGSSGGTSRNGGEGGRTTGTRKGKGRGSNGGRGGRSIAYSGLRNSVLQGSSGRVRELAFTPASSGDAILELSAIGVSNDEPLVLKSINGVACDGMPRVEVTEEIRVHLSIELETLYVGPIRLVLARPEEAANAN